jgi:hypothetical protein
MMLEIHIHQDGGGSALRKTMVLSREPRQIRSEKERYFDLMPHPVEKRFGSAT